MLNNVSLFQIYLNTCQSLAIQIDVVRIDLSVLLFYDPSRLQVEALLAVVVVFFKLLRSSSVKLWKVGFVYIGTLADAI